MICVLCHFTSFCVGGENRVGGSSGLCLLVLAFFGQWRKWWSGGGKKNLGEKTGEGNFEKAFRQMAW